MAKHTFEKMKNTALQLSKETARSPFLLIQESVEFKELSDCDQLRILAYIEGIEDGVRLVTGQIK